MESIDENFAEGEMKLSTESLENLRLTARWTQFLSIVGFIGLGLMILGALVLVTVNNSVSSFSRYNSDMDMSTLAIVYFVMGVIYFFPIYYLYQFSLKMKRSIDSKDSVTFTEATRFLKSHYQFVGILAIIIISLYILLILAGIGAASYYR